MFGLDTVTFSDFLDHYQLALNALAVSVYTLCVMRITAFNTVMIGIVALSYIHFKIKVELVPLFGVEQYSDVIGYAWYLSFAFVDVLFVAISYLLIKHLRLTRDRGSYCVIAVMAFMAFVQIFRMCMWHNGSQFGYDFYSFAVVMGHNIIVITACIMALRTVFIRTGMVNLLKRSTSNA